jgi:hypothetical protein
MNGNLSVLLLLLMYTDSAILNSQILIADLVHLATYWKRQEKRSLLVQFCVAFVRLCSWYALSRLSCM